MSPLSPTAFGIQPRRPGEADPGLAAGGWAGMVRQLDELFGLARRDAAIAWASGRWRPGRPDPERYLPGDIVALRAFSVASDLSRLYSYQEVINGPSRSDNRGDVEARRKAMDRTLLSLADTKALFDAVPHFLDGDAAMGILASRPPSLDDVADLRLPYPRTAVYFGRVLELGPELHDWPRSWDHLSDLAERPTAERSAIGDLRALGGGIEGVVLTEAPGGGLGDEVLWLVSANPDPARPAPATLDRYRALVWGQLSSARLAPVAHNLAATLAWAEWREPDRSLDLPHDVGSKAWRKSVRRGDFRRREPRGDAAGVRVLDVVRTPIADRMSSRPRGTGNKARPATHLRRPTGAVSRWASAWPSAGWCGCRPRWSTLASARSAPWSTACRRPRLPPKACLTRAKSKRWTCASSISPSPRIPGALPSSRRTPGPRRNRRNRRSPGDVAGQAHPTTSTGGTNDDNHST